MNPEVSVYCLAYNHEKYVRQTIEGFIQQKTNFAFEVIIHDDASTDGTAAIIKEYSEKYPDLIKPIFQTENQYSKGVGIFRNFIHPLLKGKYVAICEGDDYWCDEMKLQRQYDWLEQHDDYSMCVHNSKVLDCTSGIETNLNPENQDKDITIDEIIQRASSLFHTSSYMFRIEYSLLPTEFVLSRTGDYSRAVFLATKGKIRFLHNVMSVYRKFSGNSWTDRMYRSYEGTKNIIAYRKEKIHMLQNVDIYTKGIYSKIIQRKINSEQLAIYVEENDINNIKVSYPDYYEKMNGKVKFLMKLKNTFPHLYNIYIKIKKNSIKK